MVFKRYITRSGKKLGPYYYKNIRDKNGDVKTIYLGTKNPEEEEVSIPEIKTEKVGVYRVNEDQMPVKEKTNSYIPSFSIRTNLIISLILLIFVIWFVFSDSRVSFIEKLTQKPIYIILISLAVFIVLLLSTTLHYHIGRKIEESIRGRKSSFIIILIFFLLLFICYRTWVLYKNQIFYYYSIYWPIIRTKIMPYLLIIKDNIPYKNPLFYPILEISIALLIILIVIILHRRKTNVDLRNYIIVKKMIKIIKKEETEHRKRQLYKKVLNLYNGLSEKRSKKLEKKVIKLSKTIKDEN